MNLKGYVIISFLAGLCVALASYVYSTRIQPTPVNEDTAPVLLGKLTNPGGSVVEVFEMRGSPPSIFCVIAVSASTGNPMLYPIVSCVKR